MLRGMIRLYGSTTSPYVRRVRIVAEELSLAYQLVDTATDSGQALLRQTSPIWKVPAAEIDGELLFDSHDITELLLERHGQGRLCPFALDDFEARRAMSVIDGALDALINAFYLRKDGVDIAQVAYARKQTDRAHNALSHLETSVFEPWVTSKRALGLPEIALATALEWMRFRDAYPVASHPRLMRCLAAVEARPSFVATRPR